MRRHGVLGLVLAAVASVAVVGSTLSARQGPADPVVVSAAFVGGETLRVSVPGAEGGKTVIGQLTVARAVDAGFVTAYPCADGIPRRADGAINRSDLNYEGRTSPVWSNRLIVEADDAGDVCLRSSTKVEFVVDVNAVSFDSGITSFANRRTDTRIDETPVEAGEELRLEVPEAAGGKTVIGQLTATRVAGRGFVTAYACADGMPVDGGGRAMRSDLNVDAASSTVNSNRLIVAADESGAICLRSSERLHLVVDLNGVTDAGVESLINQRTDTRSSTKLGAGDVLRVNVPAAADSKTVIGQLTAARSNDLGFVTAYPCASGVPVDRAGRIDRSDVNGNGLVGPVWSNRLIVEADDAGDVCFHTSNEVHLVVDVHGISDGGITSFANVRIDTREETQPPATELPTDAVGTPVWPPYTPLAPLDDVAALTGLPAGPDVTTRPVVAAKIDNYRLARPHAGLNAADVVFEVNTEFVSRFIALFHTQMPTRVGPVRSARTTDVDLLSAMNRPIFGFSGANPGVNRWLDSATESGVLVERGAQTNGCYARDVDRPGPHNLFMDPQCMVSEVPWAGAAQPMWAIEADWQPDTGSQTTGDATFDVAMDGVHVQWTWDAGSGRYLRSQDGAPHLAEGGGRVAADNVVEVVTVYAPSTVDARSPHAISIGSGPAVVHRDGRATEAVWHRASPSDEYTFRDAVTGTIVPLDVGTTFVELTRS